MATHDNIRSTAEPDAPGVYSSDVQLPLAAFAAGLGDHKIYTALCPCGDERMRRLMSIMESSRDDFGSLVTHHYALDNSRGLRPVRPPARRSAEGRHQAVRREGTAACLRPLSSR